ncbi:30S ribosomal protein S12 methylthiotransferase RimO [Alcaligenes aquatilis]|jgi:ribosomal protein S12 methylthiotransferase|uniref:Ribosomal protein uS12 methylthiotransferase RimO n=2 Tax=Alcaligenes TaxID=507 RepID=A0AB33CWF9_ALCFA|nr:MULTISPECIES: 30S ribosomal protein S12 methylthiotransferase RimO [Alcaligenes]ASR90923.1 30S ribosomal protein S12 methylthiotransferase RimO [Alcaligenes faecalis]AWG36412.1 30S ribosomal protein S12 methylthiotransferase RimO [Alcaligenes aquatilis]QXR35587.1 30S ribosomal protein S12 methylthiotransferase RimO [Alcaligenes aquatilis]UQN35668.1 30S ribosomal protein S12 methylthiotransferase RimO [Alcaligenes aquatilis]HBQ90368.1 30S ribosomal protein S12 methylthiotransferase RimO [Alc
MSAPKVGFVSLGCPKALVDSERILTQLRTDGYQITPSYDNADVVVVNTCGFIDSAKAESLEAIGEALAENGRVIVTGCMGVDEGLIRDVHPSVLSVSGPQQYEQVLRAVREAAPPSLDHNPYIDLVPPQGIKLTPRHYAYLKISEGCNHSCSFCIIPSMRGKLVSRPVGDVLGEAERLVKAGVKELLVISQDTSAYGVDIRQRTGFWNGRPVKSSMLDLSAALSELGAWVRLHYVYPYPHVDNIIPLMAEGKVLPYLDIPFQHASPSVLRAMKRPAFEDRTLSRIKQWRQDCPDLTIRSTFIVGFPGETEEDFQYLLDWMTEAQLDRVGCFQYSPVEGASANKLDGIVPDEVKQERWERFMEHQQAISTARLAAKVGREMDVLIDEIDEDGDAVGRSSADAPEIDGNVFITSEQKLEPGQMVRVRITDSSEYDLFGEQI